MQNRKRQILQAAKAVGLFALARRRSALAVRIVCYHGLWLGDACFPGDSMFMQPETFQRRMQIIKSAGYRVVSLDAALAALSGHSAPLPAAAVVITIDDGWASTATGMLPVLAAHAMPATLYCDTAQLQRGSLVPHVLARYLDLIAARVATNKRASTDAAAAARARAIATDLNRGHAERLDAAHALAAALGLDIRPLLAARTFAYMTPTELVSAVADNAGLDVQLHTHNHTLGDFSSDMMAREIAANRQSLADLLNRAPQAFQHFCYPSGVATASAARTLANLGLASATTTKAGLAWPGTALHLLPRILDGENLSDIEFEAELSGFSDWLRAARHAVRPSAMQRSINGAQPA